ncbi:MAG: competence/damage-inducible protein A [Syntrophaceae bacterium]|nr:competence/damage-inducible protein A [Syntrophaceae bacterium]
MKTGILTIGNELTSGRTQDSNSAFIARTMREQGWSVTAMLSVGDEAGAIREALEFMLARCEALVVTGGLGPTTDDITTGAIAQAFGLPLRTDAAVLAHIRERFARRKTPWTENNAKQAAFPEGAEVIPNRTGTAAGFALRRASQMIAVLPGVPAEARMMLAEEVIPMLRRTFPAEALHVESRTYKLSGLSESAVDQAVTEMGLIELGIDCGFYPNSPEIHLVLTTREPTTEAARQKLIEAACRVEARLGKQIFAQGQETLEEVVGGQLTGKGLTLAVAESCTGGLITDRLTDITGSSVFLERGVVAYSNRAKEELLGIPAAVIAAHGAVSEETARLMAEGVRRLASTGLGLGVTGIAGPDGGTEDKPVGTVYIALTDGRRTLCRRFNSPWLRRHNKVVASQFALLMLREFLTEEDGGGK